MRIDRRIIAGTALGLLMATGSGAAAATSTTDGQTAAPRAAAEAPILLAQADIEVLKRKLKDPGLTDEQRTQIQQQIDAAGGEQPAGPAAGAPPPPPAERTAPPPPPEAKPAPAEGAKPAPADAPKPAPKDAGPASAPPPHAEQPAPPPEGKPAPAEGAKPAPAGEPQPAGNEAGGPPPPPPPAEQPAPPPEGKPAPAEGAKPAPAGEPKPAGNEAGAPPSVPEQAAPPRKPRPEQAGRQKPDDRPRPPEGQGAPDKGPAGAPPPPPDNANVLPENAAPVLDSQKEAEQPAGKEPADGPGRPHQQPGGQTAAPAAPAGPPPKTDADAQKQTKPVKVESLRSTKGQPVDGARVRERMQDREGANVLKEIGDRLLIQLGNRTIVESNDRPRLTHGARDVRYEDLPGGWTREVIARPDGSSVITIRDRFGDIIRRSRVTADGREYVLVYASDRDHGPDRGSRGDRGDAWRDPGRDLPPLRLTIPVNQYILDAGRVQDPRRYYDFLEEPPVEPVRRLYSLDEVKYSARVRDTMRRIDLDVINFDTGSASVGDSEVRKLDSVADAIARIIKGNPAETFLIEGHTDAVGSDQSNLVLSDRRAESVAAALTDVFGIPPENLVTQGYGERYLKVETQDASRANRRVAIRRITPLVAPVAGAN